MKSWQIVIFLIFIGVELLYMVVSTVQQSAAALGMCIYIPAFVDFLPT